MAQHSKHETVLLEVVVENDVLVKWTDEIESLKRDILNTDRSVDVARKRQKLSPEEAGEGLLMNILQISLNPAVLGLLIKVIHDWFRYKTAVQKRPFKLIIKTDKGEITIETERDIDPDELLEKVKGNIRRWK